MLRTAAALALLVILIGVTGAREAHAGGVLIVDSYSDSATDAGCYDQVATPPPGNCSLRSAILIGNSDPSLKAIVFALPAIVPIITPGTPLPDITEPVLMDGATGGSDAVRITGISSGAGSDGLRLVNHTGSTVTHMVINGWDDSGIVISGGGSHKIVGNKIGTDAAGTSRFSNLSGIFMQNTTGNTVGGATADRNVISGNLGDAVRLDEGANNNTVAGNFIGLGADGSTIIDNCTGITIFGSGNQIGSAAHPNVIAGNGCNGVVINGPNNRVQGNLIGVNSLGQAKPNQHNGLFLDNSSGTIIGGSLQDGNVISGNAESGVYMDLPINVEISGNIIGLNPEGDGAVPNGRERN